MTMTIDELREYLVRRSHEAGEAISKADKNIIEFDLKGDKDQVRKQRVVQIILSARKNLYDELVTIIDSGVFPA